MSRVDPGCRLPPAAAAAEQVKIVLVVVLVVGRSGVRVRFS